MKRFILFLGCLGMVVACNKNLQTEGTLNEEYYTVRFTVGGEIVTSDSPLTKSMGENDLLGIIIAENAEYTSKQYIHAAGLFDNTTNMSVNLKKGTNYILRCTLVKTGKNTLTPYTSGTYTGYYEPFGRHENGYVTEMTTEVKNYFGYMQGAPEYYYYYSVGKTISDSRAWSVMKGKVGGADIDRYFTEQTFTTTQSTSINLDLRHTVFGVKYKVTGITDGTLSLVIDRADPVYSNVRDVFFSESAIASDVESEGHIFECNDIYSAWQYPTTYKETAKVSLKWTREIGIEQDLGSVDIELLRNRMNIININLGADDGNASFGINTEDAEMGNESVTINVG